MSIRDALSESIDELEAGDALDEPQQEIITETVDDVTDDVNDATDNADEGTPDESDSIKEDVGDEAAATSAETDGEPPTDSDPKPNKDSIKAPASWKPAEREQWSKVPRPLQERIMAREKEISDNLTNTKAARDVSEYVNKMGQQYEPLLNNSGFNHPLEAASAALDTMNVLSRGSAQQKASEVAKIIAQFGVDIETLDQALVNSPDPQRAALDPATARMEEMLNERLAPFNQLMTQQQQAQQQQQQERVNQANSAVENFAEKAEFLGDVREDMADIIDLANKRGVSLTLQQAYDRACAAHPEISNVLAERRRNEEITGKRDEITGKRNAASSISGRQGGNGGQNGGGSLRDTIVAAMDES